METRAADMIIDYTKPVKVPTSGLEITPADFEKAFVKAEKDRVSHVLIPSRCIEKRVAVMGEEIARASKERDEIVLLVVLKGAFVFAADLGRAIYRAGGPRVRYEFIRTSTYGKEIKAGGETEREVKISSHGVNVNGDAVFVVEDIVDQGFTMSKLKSHLLKKAGAKSVSMCTLLDKRLDDPPPEVIEIRKELKLDCVGFRVPDVWVAGYGIDAGEDFRHLPCILAVDEDYYRWGR